MRRRFLVRALLAAAVALGTVLAPTARAAGQDDVLEGCGIRFPGGFDVNTLGELRGRASRLEQPPSGPVRFRLDTDSDSYTVLVAPAWYWSELKLELPDGTELVVRGSKTVGTDGSLYIVAQEMRVAATGRVVALRDRTGGPLWTGARGLGQGGGRGRMGATGGMGGMGAQKRGGRP